MDGIATEDLLLATLLGDDISGGGTALSVVLETVAGSGQRPSHQVEIAVAVETLVTKGFVQRTSDGDDERFRLTDEGRSRAEGVVARLSEMPVEVVEGDERRETTLERAAERLGRSLADVAADCSEEGIYYDQERVVGREFVDRLDERDRFQTVLERVEQTGDGAVVRLVGPGGNGKTALANALLAETPDAVDASRTGSREAETEPYRPIRTLLDGIGTDDPFETTDFDAEDTDDYEARQTGLFTEITDRLTPDSGIRVLFFDDVNHADAASWQYLGFLCARLADRPLVVVLSHRPGTLPADAPIHPGSGFQETRIEVTGLDRDGTRQLVEGVLGRRDVPETFVDAVYERTGGAPLFVETTVEALVETNQVDPQLGVYPTDADEFELPDEVVETIQQQAASLEDDVREVLEWVAVADGFVPVSLVGRTADHAPGRVETVLETVAEMGLLDRETHGSETQVAFHNEVFGDALAGRLSASERERRHETIARSLEVDERDATGHERSIDRAATVSYHYEQSGNRSSAIEWYEKSADRAREAYAHETAIDYYYRVIDLARQAGESETVLSANERLADIYLVTGEYDQADRHVQFVRERTGEDDTSRTQRLARVRARIHEARGEFDEAIEVATDALCGEDTVEECRLLDVLTAGHNEQSDYERARETAKRQRELAERIDEPSLAASALAELGATARKQGAYERAREYYERSLATSEAVGDRRKKAASLTGLGGVAWRRGNLGQAAEYFEDALAIHRETGDFSREAASLHNLGLIAVAQGNYDRAREHLEESLAISRSLGDRSLMNGVLIKLGFIAEERGRYERAREYYQESLEISRDIGARLRTTSSLSNLGLIAWRRGRYDRAREYLEESLGIYREIGDPDGEAHDLSYLGNLVRQRGEYDEAREYYEQAVAIARESDLTRREPISLRGLCALARRDGDYDQARQYFERALRLSEEANKRSDVVRVRLEGGRLALARGDLETARERAETVRDTAETLGRPLSIGRSRQILGEIAAREGDVATAREQWVAAAETFEEIGALPDALQTLETLVEDCRTRGDDGRAREFCQRARAVLDDAPTPVVEYHGKWVPAQREEAGQTRADGSSSG